MRIAVLAVRPVTGEVGGAERLVAGLVEGLRAIGEEASAVDVPGDESTFESIQELYLHCYDLDLTGFDAVISTKAPTFCARHDRHVCWLVHTMRVFYDMFDDAFPRPTEVERARRETIIDLDTAALSPARTRRVVCIGREVANRLSRYNGISAGVLHPALHLSCRTGAPGGYVLVPGRLHPWKRVDLAIAAMRFAGPNARLRITGTGQDEERLHRLAAGDERIQFLGRVSDDELVALYANALGVACVPVAEDYGYVAAEAFASGKPVVTCSDSGEPARLVEAAGAGIVCEPAARALGAAFARLYADRATAAQMGACGRASVTDQSWASVARTLRGMLG